MSRWSYNLATGPRSDGVRRYLPQLPVPESQKLSDAERERMRQIDEMPQCIRHRGYLHHPRQMHEPTTKTVDAPPPTRVLDPFANLQFCLYLPHLVTPYGCEHRPDLAEEPTYTMFTTFTDDDAESASLASLFGFTG